MVWPPEGLEVEKINMGAIWDLAENWRGGVECRPDQRLNGPQSREMNFVTPRVP